MRVLLAVVVVGLACFGPSCASSTCGPANCSGCCDDSGRCQTGVETPACGAGGLTCQACFLGLTCSQGQCVPQVSTGGGTGTGGGTATGGGAGGGGGASYSNDGPGLCLAYYGETWRLYQQCGLNEPGSQYTAPTWCADFFPGTLTSAQVAPCIEGLKGLDCLSMSAYGLSGSIPGCEQIATLTGEEPGTAGLNASCSSYPISPSETCQPALFCEDRFSCPRRCLARLGAGQPVPPSEPDRCQAGLYEHDGVCTVPTPVGQSCATTNGTAPSCVANAYCKADVCTLLPARRSAVGQPCSADSDFCELGTFCDGSTCRRYAGLAAACSAVTECAPWLLCGINNECVKPGKFGAVCRSSRDCDSAFTCDIPSGQTVGACSPSTLPAGSACAYATAYRCESSTYCTARSSTMTGVCAARKTAGAACTFDEPRAQCASGLDCTAISSTNPSGVCAAPSPAGGPCRRYTSSFDTRTYGCSYATQTRLYCRPTGAGMDGICTVAKSAGAPCTWPADEAECEGFCGATSAAPNGVCVASGGPGAPCNGGSGQCQSSTYCASNGVCTARKLPGVACTSYSECFGSCTNGTCEGCP